MLEEGDSQSSLVGSQEVTSIIFFTQTTGRASKKSRNDHAAGVVALKCRKEAWQFQAVKEAFSKQQMCFD
jgi:hypothetical protein